MKTKLVHETLQDCQAGRSETSANSNPLTRMYVVGFFDQSKPNSIINPEECRTLWDLQCWLIKRYSCADFKDEFPSTIMSIASSILLDQTIILRFAGIGSSYGIIFGYKNHIMDNMEVVISILPV